MAKSGGFGTFKEQVRSMNEGALTIPNALSVLRIISIPVFVWFFMDEKYMIAVLVLFVSGMTDLFDGKIARHFNQISKLGKLLDPLADKLTQITVTFVYFIAFHRSEEKTLRAFSYVFLLFILKELIMVVGSIILLSKDVVPSAAIIYGKVATVVFYLVMGFLMLFAPGFGAFNRFFTLPNTVLMILVIISAVLTVVALISYIPGVVTGLKEKKKATEKEEKQV